MTSNPWPQGFPRVPDEEWVRRPVERLAEHYDTVERHGWYDNLDTTVETLATRMQAGQRWIDYSGGTGILIDRLFAAIGNRPVGILNADSSPKFLRLSHEKLAHDPRTAFRLIHYLHEQRRLQLLDECLGAPLADHGIDGLVSTNAIHLYYDLSDTLAAWHRVLKPGGYLHVQSGNIAPDGDGAAGGHIIDDTVHAIARIARDLVAEDDTFARYRSHLDDTQRMARYDTLREKYFLPPRPLAHYTNALESAGFSLDSVQRIPIEARVDDWFEFLSVYHDGVLGWIGGVEKLEGTAPSAHDVDARLALMRRALHRLFDGADTFRAEWTYVDGHAGAPPTPP